MDRCTLRHLPALTAMLLLGNIAWAEVGPSDTPTYAFKGGRWFDGEGFVKKTYYSVKGCLTDSKPRRIDKTISLGRRFVVPPYGEAHNHNVEGAGASAVIARYLKEGIFYVKNPGSFPKSAQPVTAIVNRPESIDAVFSTGGITGAGGHPMGLVKRNVDAGGWPENYGEGWFYYTIDDEAELAARWSEILAAGPDFIKTYLLYSEEFELRKSDPAYFAWKGMNPNLLPSVVRRAHRSGLRVSTHIESATDFHHALIAGVDEINHLAGFRPQDGVALETYEISEEDAALAAEQGTFVVTTLAGVHPRLTRELHKRNLSVLKRHGVRLAIGSDAYRQTATIELRYLDRLRVFSRLELMKMWCETTAATIFPSRKIGKLAEGYEASFLVLEENPLEDIRNLLDIHLRVKQGTLLDIEN